MNTGVINPNIFPSGSDKQTSSKDDTLDQDAFLQLLVTQLRYQNPAQPMGNAEFIAQSAQFSSLEQMTALNTSIKELIELQKSSGKAEALDLIGKSVVVQQPNLSLSNGLPVDLAYSLSEDASVTINIHNGGGETVRAIEVGDQLAGEHTFTWDGLNNEGLRMPDGEYTYSVSGVDSIGNEVIASEIISGVVDGLVFGDEPYISIGGIRVPLTAVTEVILDTPES